MDIRDSKWYGQLHVSGHKPIESGPESVMTLVSGFVAQLRAIQPRQLASGKSISITLQETPFIDRPTSQQAKLAQEVDASLDTAETQVPGPEESYDDFYDRLVAAGNDPATARFVADDWFDHPQDPELIRWLNDPKAVRFRQLNSSGVAFLSALPSEYETLKHYVIANYPNQVSGLVFRTV